MDVQEVCERKLKMDKQQSNQAEERKKASDRNKELYIKKVLREVGAVLSHLKISKSSLDYLEMGSLLQKM